MALRNPNSNLSPNSEWELQKFLTEVLDALERSVTRGLQPDVVSKGTMHLDWKDWRWLEFRMFGLEESRNTRTLAFCTVTLHVHGLKRRNPFHAFGLMVSRFQFARISALDSAGEWRFALSALAPGARLGIWQFFGPSLQRSGNSWVLSTISRIQTLALCSVSRVPISLPEVVSSTSSPDILLRWQWWKMLGGGFISLIMRDSSKARAWTKLTILTCFWFAT